MRLSEMSRASSSVKKKKCKLCRPRPARPARDAERNEALIVLGSAGATRWAPAARSVCVLRANGFIHSGRARCGRLEKNVPMSSGRHSIYFHAISVPLRMLSRNSRSVSHNLSFIYRVCTKIWRAHHRLLHKTSLSFNRREQREHRGTHCRFLLAFCLFCSRPIFAIINS